MIEELESLFNKNPNLELRAYFKMDKGMKTYYDFQNADEIIFLKGSYDVVCSEELVYYLREQNYEASNI